MILCVCRCAHLYTMFTFWFFSWILYWGKSFSESLECSCWVNWKRTINITLRFCPSKKSNKSWGDLERIILRISAPPELLPEFFFNYIYNWKKFDYEDFLPPKIKIYHNFFGIIKADNPLRWKETNTQNWALKGKPTWVWGQLKVSKV